MKLKILQLTLAQSGKHQSSRNEETFLMKLFCLYSLHKQYKNDNIANFVYLREFNSKEIVWSIF